MLPASSLFFSLEAGPPRGIVGKGPGLCSTEAVKSKPPVWKWAVVITHSDHHLVHTPIHGPSPAPSPPWWTLPVALPFATALLVSSLRRLRSHRAIHSDRSTFSPVVLEFQMTNSRSVLWFVCGLFLKHFRLNITFYIQYYFPSYFFP